MKTFLLKLLVILALSLPTILPAADAQKIGNVDTSQWRGFNLLEKFTLRGNAPFKEDDFKWIAELGFTYRLRAALTSADWLPPGFPEGSSHRAWPHARRSPSRRSIEPLSGEPGSSLASK